MKKITFRADERMIERAHAVALSQHTTLAAAFRDWLSRYVEQASSGQVGGVHAFHALMERLSHVHSGGPYSRDQFNTR